MAERRDLTERVAECVEGFLRAEDALKAIDDLILPLRHAGKVVAACRWVKAAVRVSLKNSGAPTDCYEWDVGGVDGTETRGLRTR
jgi:hypothetical protein